MIKVNMITHSYEASGSKVQLFTEVSSLLHILYEKGIFEEKDMHRIVEISMMNSKELRAKTEKIIGEYLGEGLMSKVIFDAMTGNKAAKDLLDALMKMKENE